MNSYVGSLRMSLRSALWEQSFRPASVLYALCSARPAMEAILALSVTDRQVLRVERLPQAAAVMHTGFREANRAKQVRKAEP